MREKPDIPPLDDFYLYRDGTWGRPFTVTRKSTGTVDRYAANVVWKEDDDGALHICGQAHEEQYTLEDDGADGRMTTHTHEPSATYAPDDWERQFIVPE